MGSIGFQDKPRLAIRAALGTAQARALASVPIGTGSGPHAHVLSVFILPHILVLWRGFPPLSLAAPRHFYNGFRTRSNGFQDGPVPKNCYLVTRFLEFKRVPRWVPTERQATFGNSCWGCADFFRSWFGQRLASR